MLKSVVWFITMNCQNHCPYCWERQRQAKGEFTPEKFRPFQEWVEGWNRIAADNMGASKIVIDITGGEPFLQPGFVDILDGLNDIFAVAITTNTKTGLVEFVQRITPAKVFSITASFHPTQDDLDMFMGRILLLKHRGFRVVINFVAWPEQMWLIPVIKERAEREGFIFHVDPYAASPYVPFELNQKEIDFLGTYVKKDRKIIREGKTPVVCSAGHTHIAVFPDGNAYRCVNDKINGARPIGNILNEKFEIRPAAGSSCDDYNACAGCDRDKVEVTHVR